MEKFERKLGILKVASSLASVHFGLGFLLGTAEAVYNFGPAGILYSLSCSLGLILIAFLVPFYWKNKVPIWDLLGKMYGRRMQKGSGILSWIWMVGVVGSQMLGATFILKILGVSPFLGMTVTAVIISILALWPIRRLSSVYFYLLLISSVSLLYVLTKINPVTLVSINFGKDFFASLYLSPLKTMGIFIPTIFVTVLGMDFHQFIIRGKTIKKSIIATILAGLFLFLIAVLLTFVVLAAVRGNILPSNMDDGKEVIPFVLMFVGKSLGKIFISYLLIISLLTAALGSGSAVSKILINIVQDLKIFPQKFYQRGVVVLLNSSLAFFLALTGKSIISLIVSFYAIYVAGVLVPFIVYILQRNKLVNFKGNTVYFSLLAGGLTSLGVLILSKINLVSLIMGENVEFWIICIGIIGSTIPLIISYFNSLLKSKIAFKRFCGIL